MLDVIEIKSNPLNNIYEYPIRKQVKKSHRKHGHGRFLITLAALVLCIMLVNSVALSAGISHSLSKVTYYKNIVVEPGDTFLSIAQRYNNDDTISDSEYAHEIMKLNGLTADDLRIGRKLVISYTESL